MKMKVILGWLFAATGFDIPGQNTVNIPSTDESDYWCLPFDVYC